MAIYYGDGSNSNNGRVIQHDEVYGAQSRYTISSGNWHEVNTNFRCQLTPKANGNILKCTLTFNPSINNGEYGGVIPVMHNGISNCSLFGEQDSGSGLAKTAILNNNNAINEQFRVSSTYHFWQACVVGTWTVDNAGVAHYLKMYAQMGSGDIILGDNTLQCFMQMEELEP